MKLINSLVLITLFFTIFSANADSTVNDVKGEAIIIVDNKTYTLLLKKCYSATNIEDEKTLEAFVIATHQSRKSKESEPRFSATGSKSEKTGFSLQIDGGFSKGGTRYQGKMPYESFKNSKLTFEGETKSLKRDNKKLIKKVLPITINVQCF